LERPSGLDAIIDGLGCIRKIVLTETFQKEEDEQLNAEEQKVADENTRLCLQREDPRAWEAKQAAVLAQARKQQQSMYSAPATTTQLRHQCRTSRHIITIPRLQPQRMAT